MCSHVFLSTFFISLCSSPNRQRNFHCKGRCLRAGMCSILILLACLYSCTLKVWVLMGVGVKPTAMSRSFAFDLYFTKHLREEMTANPVYPEALPYVFGKSNSMFSLRFLREHRKELSPKLRFGAVQVGTVMGARV